MATYDLITEPWVRVRSRDGELQALGLRDLLIRAHELGAIEHPIPIVEAGIWRLLVALALDIFEVDRLRQLADLIRRGRFSEDVVDSYFDQHSAAFDLFSDTRPFLQQAKAGGPEKPVAALLPSQPSGTNVVHWHHGHEAEFAVSPGEAAGLLAAVAPFMTAGGAGLSPSINGAPPWYVMIEGPTLFHSIMLNVWGARPQGVQRGVPAWRRRAPLETTRRRQDATLAESLTWQPRTIRLIPERGGRCSLSGQECDVVVRRMHFTKGESCDFQWTDPNVGYSIGKSGMTAVRPQEDRVPWRDLGPLALLQHVQEGERQVSRPQVITQFGQLMEEYLLDLGDLRIRLYGMRTDGKMKVFEWYREEFHLPAQVSYRRALQDRLVEAIRRAESVQGVLRSALSQAATIAVGTDRQQPYTPGSESVALIRSASRAYWAALDEPFRRLAFDLGGLDPEHDVPDIERVQAAWWLTLRRTACDAFDSATDHLRHDGAHIMSISRARSYLLRRTSEHERQHSPVAT